MHGLFQPHLLHYATAGPQARAAQFAANVVPIIREIQAAGYTSFNAIAGQLNARKVATANGGQWRLVQVRQILGRAAVGRRSPAKEIL